MTARQEARVGSRTTDGARWSYETQRAPKVGEILQTARERKGVDLTRAERETKIRVRHLAALESGDVADLPALVYAKGFLRNYATYLGLDADEVLARWRKEIDQPGSADTPRIKPPPQPITTPSRGLKLTTGLIVALALATIVFAFVGYVGLQLVRFTQNPEIALNGPSIRQLQPGAERLVLSGTGTPAALVTATGADDLVRNTTADQRGEWTLDLPVTKGRNDFDIITTDGDTARDSEPLHVIATVPVLDIPSTEGDLAPALPEGVDTTNLSGTPSAQLVLISPVDALRSDSGKVKVEGTSDAESVLVSAQWLGNLDREPTAPQPVALPVTDGVFRGSLQLPKGRWQVSVAAARDGGTPAVTTVPVRSMVEDMVVTVTALVGPTRVKILNTNGETIAEEIRLEPGQSKTYRLDPEVIVKVGNAKAANVTVDGVQYGPMGSKAEAKAWLIQQGERPRNIS
jgi:transcriptional regulator with XRE-family HTH domain